VYLREYEHLTLARVLIARGGRNDLKDADSLLGRLLEPAEAGGRQSAAIEIHLLRALAQAEQGDTGRAAASLEGALGLAAPERHVRLFADEGSRLAPLLQAVAAQGEYREYCRRLLTAIAEGATPAAAAPAGDVETLSEREQDVLRLLATDLSGPEIANELVVSLNTLRTHTKNIYGKLGATSRRAAVRRATELGLI
jgi:LuxR family maltose regulon positive regulatory protein